jgi:WD40 repeat protein
MTAVSDDHIQIVYHAPANSAVIPLAWSPNSRYIALADTAHAALVLNVSSSHTMFAAANAPTGGHSLAWSSDSTMIAAVNQQSQVQVWNIARGQTRFTITSVRADAVAWSPNGTHLASVGQDGAVRIWKASEGQGVATLPAQSKYDITSAPMWSPNSKERAFQLSTLDNESMKVWDVSTDQQVLSYGGHTTAAFLFAREPSSGTPTINAFAWSPDGKQVVLGCGRDAEIWHPA